MKGNQANWLMFTAVQVLFTVGMVLLIVNYIKSWLVWALYISFWIYIDQGFSKKIKIKNWIWGLMVLVLASIDLLLLIRIYHQ